MRFPHSPALTHTRTLPAPRRRAARCRRARDQARLPQAGAAVAPGQARGGWRRGRSSACWHRGATDAHGACRARPRRGTTRRRRRASSRRSRRPTKCCRTRVREHASVPLPPPPPGCGLLTRWWLRQSCGRGTTAGRTCPKRRRSKGSSSTTASRAAFRAICSTTLAAGDPTTTAGAAARTRSTSTSGRKGVRWRKHARLQAAVGRRAHPQSLAATAASWKWNASLQRGAGRARALTSGATDGAKRSTAEILRFAERVGGLYRRRTCSARADEARIPHSHCAVVRSLLVSWMAW